MARAQLLEWRELELRAAPPGVAVQQPEHAEHGTEAGTEDRKESADLLFGICCVTDRRREHELQGIDVEEYTEQQRAVEYHRDGILEPIAPEVAIVLIPDNNEQSEADTKCREPPHGFDQLGV